LRRRRLKQVAGSRTLDTSFAAIQELATLQVLVVIDFPSKFLIGDEKPKSH